MTPHELAGWTAQQSARHERTFAPARLAAGLDAARCGACGAPMGLERILGPLCGRCCRSRAEVCRSARRAPQPIAGAAARRR
jgi:hypothetical protein